MHHCTPRTPATTSSSFSDCSTEKLRTITIYYDVLLKKKRQKLQFWATRFIEVDGFLSFCQVLGFSAKFVGCLPSLLQSVQSFCQVRGTELAKIANAKLLHTPMMEFVGFVLSYSELAFFANGFVLAGRSNPRKQKREKPNTERRKGIHPATSTS